MVDCTFHPVSKIEHNETTIVIEWLNMHVEYWHWIVAGLLFVLSETFLTSFIFLWIGVSAVVVGITLLLIPISFNTQLILWMLLSLVCLVLWFKFISPSIKTRSLAGMAMESLIGQQATVVLFDGASGNGKVKFSVPVLGSEQWAMICHDAVIPGDRVKVTDVLGNKLLTRKV